MPSRAALVILLAGLGSLALVVASQRWIVLVLSPGAAAVERLDVSGQQLAPALSPLALAALASALALTIAGRVFRRVLGAIVVLLGAGITVVGTSVLGDPAAAAGSSLATVTGLAGEGSRALVVSEEVSAWPLLAAGVGAVLAVAGVLVVVLAGRWPGGGRRFRAAGAPVPAVDSGPPDRISEWDALSSGTDPSAEEARAPDGGGADGAAGADTEPGAVR